MLKPERLTKESYMNAFETCAKYESSPKIRNRLQNNCALVNSILTVKCKYIRAVAKLQQRIITCQWIRLLT